MRPCPTLRRHKPRSLGVVTLNGRVHYLGRWPADEKAPPPDVQLAYDQLIAEWLANGRRPIRQGAAEVALPSFTVADLVVAFWVHVETHYRRPDGTPTNEVRDYRLSLRPLAELYDSLPVAEFSPLKLKAIRQRMIDQDLSRGVVNQRVARVVRMFAWGVSEELVPETVHRALKTVKGLQAGRAAARETEPVRPVDDAVVEATIPFLPPPLRAVVRLQRLTGIRPGEVLAMRPGEIDRSGPLWVYRPAQHKTGHRGKERAVTLGPRAQEVLKPYLDGRAEDAYLFTPREAMEAVWAARRAARKTKVQPSQKGRATGRRLATLRPSYTTQAYLNAIVRASRKAGVEHWHPHQLRHTFATEVRRLFGLEASQVLLGHAQANVTQVYAERDAALAVKVAAEIG